jgi:hypothetical protein
MKRSSMKPSTSAPLMMFIFWSTVASYFSTSTHFGLIVASSVRKPPRPK